MCGIAGFAARDPDASVERELPLRMARTLAHRGPDGEGVHVAPGVGLGVRRLSIVDVEHGDQPIANEDGSVVLVCNGEIYNAPELRARLEAAGHRFRSASDVEVIVHLYEEHGPDAVLHLRGMFGFALWDARRKRLVLGRDRLGIKPVCYHESAEGLWFASEAKAILASERVERRLDPGALHNVLTLGFVGSPRTLFAGISRLPAGCVLIYERGRARIERYWEVSFPKRAEQPARREEEWAEELRAKLTETVRIHLRSDVPVGMYLSGGLDSSSVASLMCSLVTSPVHSYSIGFDVDGFDELRRQRLLYDFPEFRLEPSTVTATAADFASLPRAVWAAEDVAAAGGALWGMRLARLASRDVKVVLAGEGADEALGGYRWYHGQKVLGPLGKLPLSFRKLLIPIVRRWGHGAVNLLLAPGEMCVDRFEAMLAPPHREDRATLLTPDLLRAVEAEPPFAGPDLPDAFHGWHRFDQLQFFDLKVRMVDFIVHVLDRASMSQSVEARVPFLDHELLELCCRIPPRMRMKGLREKHILRRAMLGLLPDEIRLRPKHGAVAPVAHWLRAPLPEFAADALSPRRLAATGYFVPQTVQTLLERHQSGARDHSRELFMVLSLQLWHELFVAAPPGAAPPAALFN